MTPTKAALNFIRGYGSIDGAHHKQWVLDQVVRILTVDDAGYKKWVVEHNAGKDGPHTYEWDEGCVP